jgi:hypothetical protein
MKRLLLLLTSVATVAAVLFTSDSRTSAQGQGLAAGAPAWVPAVRHDTSRPLREMTPMPATTTRADFEVKEPALGPPSVQQDTAVQSFPVAPLAASSVTNFDGVGEGHGEFSYNVNSAPPDTTGEAGPNHYVQWVNTSFAIFGKGGNLLYGPAGGNTLFTGFGGDCEARNDGDPIVQYDQLADRWVMTQFSIRAGNYLQCVAVSQTGDPRGAWHRYAFSYEYLPDYPKLSVWPDAYYITFNMFEPSGNSYQFRGGRVCAYDRAKMLAGQAAAQICFTLTSYSSFLTADLDSTTLPPAGTPNYVMTLSGGMSLFKFRPNFVNPSASTFTGPTSIPVAAYSNACGSCVPQPGTTQTLDTLGSRLMYRLAYRNLGTRESLVANHTVASGSVTSIRWYEFDITGGVPTVRQQSTYQPGDGLYRWMGSIAMDKMGNIAVGYSTSSATSRPSIKFAGRESTDPLNSLSTETNLHDGTGSQTTGLSRWGDYSSMTLDPVDECTFWFTSEYLQTNGTFNWSTRIGSFKFSSCGASATPDFSLGATPSSGTVTQGGSANYTVTVTPTNGYNQSGSYTTGPLPEEVMAGFSPATFGGPSASTSTLTLSTTTATPVGTHAITVFADDGTTSHSTTVTLVVNAPAVPDFTLTASPASRTVKRGRSTTYTISATRSGGFTGAIALTVEGCPANTTCTVTPSSISGTSTATLTVATTNTTPKGTFALNVSGTGSGVSGARTATATLKVQ